MQRLKKGGEENQEAHSTSQREMVLQSLFLKKFTSAFFVWSFGSVLCWGVIILLAAFVA